MKSVIRFMGVINALVILLLLAVCSSAFADVDSPDDVSAQFGTIAALRGDSDQGLWKASESLELTSGAGGLGVDDPTAKPKVRDGKWIRLPEVASISTPSYSNGWTEIFFEGITEPVRFKLVGRDAAVPSLDGNDAVYAVGDGLSEFYTVSDDFVSQWVIVGEEARAFGGGLSLSWDIELPTGFTARMVDGLLVLNDKTGLAFGRIAFTDAVTEADAPLPLVASYDSGTSRVTVSIASYALPPTGDIAVDPLFNGGTVADIPGGINGDYGMFVCASGSTNASCTDDNGSDPDTTSTTSTGQLDGWDESEYNNYNRKTTAAFGPYVGTKASQAYGSAPSLVDTGG